MTNTTTHSRKGRAAVALAAGAFGVLAALTALPGGGSEPDDEPVELARTTQEISGNCDEAEHAGDPECVGVVGRPEDDAPSTTVGATAPVATPTTGAAAQPGTTPDISGNCDEAEHAGDPECTGAVASPDDDGDDRSGHRSGDDDADDDHDDDDDRSGHRSGDDDDHDDRSGHGSDDG